MSDEAKQGEDAGEKKEDLSATPAAATVAATEATTVSSSSSSSPTSLNMTLFMYWVLPVLVLSVVSRFGVTPPASLSTPPAPRPIALDAQKMQRAKQRNKHKTKEGTASYTSPSPSPAVDLSNMPTSYQQAVKEIQKRRPRWNAGMQATASSSAPKIHEKHQDDESQHEAPSDARTASDHQRHRMDQAIDNLRKDYKVKASKVCRGRVIWKGILSHMMPRHARKIQRM